MFSDRPSVNKSYRRRWKVDAGVFRCRWRCH